jgi:hypothetical protein
MSPRSSGLQQQVKRQRQKTRDYIKVAVGFEKLRDASSSRGRHETGFA